MHIKRQLYDIIGKSKKSVLLLGPRQTGKSTLIKQLKPDIEINLFDEQTFLNFLKDPTLIKQVIKNHKTIFVDEVQKIPSLLNTIQTIIDGNKSLKFYLTGSSARKLKRGQANLLPGRVLGYEIGPLTITELKSEFNLKKALSVGTLPGPYLEEDIRLSQKVLSTYSSVYLREEVQAEALTKNLEGFSRFFDVITGYSGQHIDYTKLASLASIERMSCKRYVDILSDTLIANLIYPFSKSNKRRLIQHPKLYFFDVGVLNSLIGNFIVSDDRKGLLFEHLCLQMILSEAKARDIQINVSTYRTERGAEVDFILELNGRVFAVEVKASKNVGKSDLTGLKSFSDFYGKKHKSIVIYWGDLDRTLDDVEILGLEKAIEIIFS